tara:strand:- start:414 stop:623 length:210 start_codon:yes stop_codon:yes gene_type:complete
MKDDVILYEAGLRIGNKYSTFAQSKIESEVDEYIKIMQKTCSHGEIVKHQMLYRCISTTPLSIANTEGV